MQRERLYLLVEDRCTTPVAPSGLVLLVVVFVWFEVDDGVDEAENYALRRPIDHYVNCHVVLIDGDAFRGE